MNWTLTSKAIFGAFDGLVCVLGILLPLYHKPASVILIAALGVACAEAIGMAAGEWLSSPTANYTESAVIGASTAAGTILPALPFAFLDRPAALTASLVVTVAIGSLIAWARVQTRGVTRAVLETATVLAVAGAICAALSLAA